METSQVVQNIKENVSNKLNFKTGLTTDEYSFGYGRYFFPSIFAIYLGNGLLFARRYGLDKNSKFGALFLFSSVPLCSLFSSRVFGDEKLRDIHRLERDADKSAKYYEENKFK
jgi:hypothetical protein